MANQDAKSYMANALRAITLLYPAAPERDLARMSTITAEQITAVVGSQRRTEDSRNIIIAHKALLQETRMRTEAACRTTVPGHGIIAATATIIHPAGVQRLPILHHKIQAIVERRGVQVLVPMAEAEAETSR